MCTFSMIGDHYTDKWKDRFPNPFQPPPNTQPLAPAQPFQPAQPTITPYQPGLTPLFPHLVTKEDFDSLKKEVLEMKELLKRAKIYDEQNGEKDCQQEEKIALLRRVAEAVGINLDDVLPEKK